MSANTAPIFTKTPQVKIVTAMTVANNTADLTSGTSYDSNFVGGAFGSWVKKVRLKANPANNTAATVLRVWLNNGSAIGTASNSSLVSEFGVPATTASATAANPDFEYVVNLPVPSGYKIYYTLATAPGGSGAFTATTFGGDY